MAGIDTPFEFSSMPRFVYLKKYGVAVSPDMPYMVIGNRDGYYIASDGRWYFSEQLSGPWVMISDSVLPDSILRHDLAEIRKERDTVTRKSHQTYSQRREDNEQQRDGAVLNN